MLRQDAAKTTERWPDGAPEFTPDDDHHWARSRLGSLPHSSRSRSRSSTSRTRDVHRFRRPVGLHTIHRSRSPASGRGQGQGDRE